MTGFEFLKQYRELYEEEIELAQIKHNAFDVFDSCATEDLETSLKINWGPLYNWDNYYPHSHEYFIQDFNYVDSCFKAVGRNFKQHCLQVFWVSKDIILKLKLIKSILKVLLKKNFVLLLKELIQMLLFVIFCIFLFLI